MEEERTGKVSDLRLMRRLLRYMGPYRKQVFISLAVLLVGSVAQVSGPLLTKVAVDVYLAPTMKREDVLFFGWLSPDPMTGLFQISAIYLLVVVVGFLLLFLETYLMQWTGQHAMFDLRKELMDKLQRLDVAEYDRNPVGRLVTRVTTDVDVLNELFSSGLVMIVGDLLMLTFVLLAMFQLSPGMTLILLLVTPMVIVATAIFRRTAQEGYQRTRVAIARINAYLQEHIGGFTVMQLFNREARSKQQFEELNADYRDAFKDTIFAYGWFYPVVEFLGMLALAGLLAYGGYQVQEGALTVGVLVAFFQYGLRFFRPIQDLSEKYNILQSAMAAADKIFRLLDIPVLIHGPAQPVAVPEGPLPIEFDDVWFAYRESEWVTRGLSFRIEPGEVIAVVGHTGAGKTTLINLLLRFYDIQKGSIRAAGHDIRSFDPYEWRRRFGVVLQDPHLFSGTIRENISMGSNLADQAVLDAARQVNLGALLEAVPGGMEHVVRERGEGLSTGQKQLVNFARALAHDPQVLILDEATSSVDTETEVRIREALERLITGRTSIVIAHRLSTIQRADRIFVMHKGELREVGSHQQLLAKRGIYWHLYQLQYRDQEFPIPSPIGAQRLVSQTAE